LAQCGSLLREMANSQDDILAFFSKSKELIPSRFEETVEALEDFVQVQLKNQRKIALVTSGGTTVPLEKHTVRYLDNFSSGGRGAASAEYFLENGYAVIFLYRKDSIQPFTRRIKLLSDSFMDCIQHDESSKSIKVIPEYYEIVANSLKKHNTALSSNLLLKVTFVTIFDYLFLLKAAAQALMVHKESLIFAAAAVSDYFLPLDKMAEHKIQSSSDPLQITLQPVPKMLKELTTKWAPNSFVVTFKLETDEAILAFKVNESLKKYNQQVVIGNLLQNYSDVVHVFRRAASNHTPQTIQRSAEEKKQGIDIEHQLVNQIILFHKEFLAK